MKGRRFVDDDPPKEHCRTKPDGEAPDDGSFPMPKNMADRALTPRRG